ncbi:MAG: hypothetical protein Q8922_00570 [Bacteroidota bacterium]|nr:hypothetical protein [Bacteroidota bacterium]MDP4241662.1 hypothetical protein [Bacteroidota bacterium]MDP4286407.1 hypothetical protein [Bacteroidota bacterium]
MKRLVSISIITIIGAVAGLTIRAEAQSPEFHLDFLLRDTLQSGSHIEFGGRSIGYDPSATDSVDLQFHEDPEYPGTYLEAGNDLFFEYPRNIGETRIDIRNKPATGSFVINYVMGVSFDWYPTGRLVWDPAVIPQAVTALWLRPYNRQDTVLRDMREQSSLSLTPTENSLWNGKYLITLFYNTTPPSLGVAKSSQNVGLIVSAAAYPNPVITSGRLAVNLSEPAGLRVAGCDAAGRECFRYSAEANAGLSMLDLSSLESARGAVFLHIDATSGTRHDSRNVMVVKE